MRVLLVTSHLVPAHLAVWRAVADDGEVDLHIAGSLVTLDTGGVRPRASTPDFAPAHVFRPARLRGRDQLWWLYPGLTSLIRRLAPDIVHANSEAWGLLVAQSLHAGRVTTIHAADNLFTHGGRVEAQIRVSVARRNLRRCAGYASWNQSGVDLARRHGLPDRAPTTVVPGIVPDPSVFARTDVDRRAARGRLGLSDELKVLGFVGRLEPEKGADLLIEAASRLERTDIEIWLVGSGGALPRLLAHANAAGVRTRHIPPVEPTDVPDLLAAMNVVVVPSLTTPGWTEQFGRVVVEAMLAGTPVVATASGALPEVVGDAGIVVPENDPDAIAAALSDLLERPQLAARLVAAGRERVRSRFAPEVLARRLVEFWRAAHG